MSGRWQRAKKWSRSIWVAPVKGGVEAGLARWSRLERGMSLREVPLTSGLFWLCGRPKELRCRREWKRWPRRVPPRVAHPGDGTLPNAICEPERVRSVHKGGNAAWRWAQAATCGDRLRSGAARSSEPAHRGGRRRRGGDGAARCALVSCYAAYITRRAVASHPDGGGGRLPGHDRRFVICGCRSLGGAGGSRTRDLFNAIEARSQLRHSPTRAERPLGAGTR